MSNLLTNNPFTTPLFFNESAINLISVFLKSSVKSSITSLILKSGLSVPYVSNASLKEQTGNGVLSFTSYASEKICFTIFSILFLTNDGFASLNSKSN